MQEDDFTHSSLLHKEVLYSRKKTLKILYKDHQC